jgi:hypothetical protein
MRRRCFRTLLVLVGVLSAGVAYGGSQEDSAVAAANQWLALVDGGQYGESWKRAAILFRNAVSESKWETSISVARDPMGKFISREVLSAQFMTSLPGAPDGKYVVIQYSSVFENKRAAVETITPMLDDGEWRVSGYYIK